MRLLRYLAFTVVMLGSACAQTNEAPNDGQTHWMTHCSEDAECGGMQCICGACTTTCQTDDACSLRDDTHGLCELVEHALDTSACAGDWREVRACVPACEQTLDCRQVRSDLVCSSDGACVSGSSVVDGADGDVVAAAPLALRCGDGGELTGSGSFEVVQRDSFNQLAIAEDGVIYATLVDFSELGQIVRVDGTGTTIIAPELDGVQKLLVDDDQVLVAASDNTGQITIATIGRATEELVILAQQEGVNVHGLAVDAAFVYWVTQHSGSLSSLWRKPRTLGASEMLGEIHGSFLEDTLTIVGEQLFVLAYADGSSSAELLRVAKDGGGGITRVDGAPSGLEFMLSDGESLFFGRQLDTDEGMRVRGLVRMDPNTLAHEAVVQFSNEQLVWPSTVDARYLYWTSMPRQSQFDDAIFSVWRARKDGSAGPERLATIDAFPAELSPQEQSVYWVSFCPAGGLKHLLKVPSL